MIVYNKNIISWQAMDRIYQAIMNGVSQSSIRDQRMTSSVGATSDGKVGHAFVRRPQMPLLTELPVCGLPWL